MEQNAAERGWHVDKRVNTGDIICGVTVTNARVLGFRLTKPVPKHQRRATIVQPPKLSDKVTKHALKQISKITCIGMAKGDTVPSESDFHMRFEYLMKQLSVCVQKWRSTYLNHGLKHRTLDDKPSAQIRIPNWHFSFT